MESEPIALRRIHHVELWVANAKQAAYFYRKAFGFSQTAYAGLETGLRDSTSYVLQQDRVRLVLTSPLGGGGPITEHVAVHGDGVKDIAFEVEDAHRAFAAAVERGAEPIDEPREVADAHGAIHRAAVRTYGPVIHSFISYHGYDGPFQPGYVEQRVEEPDAGLILVDHIVGNVERGRMDAWADFYARVFGFNRYITFDDKDISTQYSALMSVVMSDDKQVIKFPINEPAEGKRTSQIQEYLDYHQGPGVQHLALLTADIVETVRRLRQRGVEFLEVPASYYEAAQERVGQIDESLEELRPLGVLIDRDDQGYLLQLFTRPLQDRPTLFIEIIQRKGARGFGKGNFKALFESIEREQQRRGNL